MNALKALVLSVLAVVVMAVGCSDPIRGAKDPIGMGGTANVGGAGGTNGDGGASSSSSDSGSTSSGTPGCKQGGSSCNGFAECCSGTCANDVCTACGTDGNSCDGGCCLGLTCYYDKCSQCNADDLPCAQSGDCCSGICAQGMCKKLDCPPGQTDCNGACKDISADVNACGSCNTKCNGGELCCAGKCKNTTDDEANCGGCGKQCIADHHCAGSSCEWDQACCDDGPNLAFAPLGDGVHGGEFVWPFTPTCNMMLTRIDMFTDGGYAALAVDVNGKPGNEIDFALLSIPLPNGWLGSKPLGIQLVAGTQYWIVHDSAGSAQTSSTVNGIPLPVYYSAAKNGPYSLSANLPLTAHLIGDCPP